MRWLALGFVSLLLCSCGSSSTPPADAPAGQPDAPTMMKDGPSQIDAPKMMDAGLMACTGMLYDACNPAASNCMGTTTCKTFSGNGFSVCTQTCSAANPCPAQGGQAAQCNGMGICKPNAPNADCTSP